MESDSDDEDCGVLDLSSWSTERVRRASYRDLGEPSEVEELFRRHLLSSPSCRSSLQMLLKSESSTTRDYSLEINVFDLLHADPVLGQLLLKYPATLLPLLENAIVQAQQALLDEHPQEGMAVKGAKGTRQLMTRVHARLVHLPPTCNITALASVEASDVGKIVQLSGTVVRASPVQMYESARTYECTGKNGCGGNFVQPADLEQRNNALVSPDSCPRFKQGGERCRGTNFKHIGSVHTDYQEIKIQEAASRIGVGHMPRSLLIKLQHDLVDTCQPGDEVVLVGSLLAQWHQPCIPEVECTVGMALKAHSIRVLQEKGSSAWKDRDATAVGELDKLRKEFDDYWQDPENQSKPIAARDFICKAVCPKLYGMYIIKLALLITLIGGVPSDSYRQDDDENQDPNSSFTQNADGDVVMLDKGDDESIDEPVPFCIEPCEATRTQNACSYGDQRSVPRARKGIKKQAVETKRRAQSHILLIGDAGTGKSQFLRFAAALCPRSVLTTGVGTTSAGLTCAAVREGTGKEFVLEAGALVLADKGVCCIDEFGCMQNQDRTSIHEAMEQMTLSVAKGGIVCKLNCRATIVAVMNPRDCLYDNHASLSRNTGLGTPLLSRFDLIFKLVDTSDAARDSNITTYLLNRAIQGSGFECNTDDASALYDAPWNMEKLRAYIALVKEKFNPKLSDDAAALLERHYERCRLAESSTIPVTVRFLESMIRLSQAHARLMYRDVVQLEDAVAVLRVMECSAFAYGGFDGNVDDVGNIMYCDPLSMDFSDQSDLDFLCFEYKILELYGMLDRLTPEQQHTALSYHIGPISNGGGEAWQQMENARERNLTEQTVQQDHYGRFHFSQPDDTSGTKRRRT